MNIQERNKLITDNLELAKKIAKKAFYKKSCYFPLDILESHDYLGLIDAASKFDSSRDIVFSTYAYWRIHGAITDGLREEGWITRTDFKSNKFHIISLEEECINLDYIQKNTNKNHIWEHYIKCNIYNLIIDSIEKLTNKERYLIIQHFFEGRTILSISKDIELSERKTFGLKDRAIRKLYHDLIDYKELLTESA